MAFVAPVLTAVILVLTLLFCLIGFWAGQRRGLKYALIRLGVIALSLALSLLIVKLAAPAMIGALAAVLEDPLSESGILDMIAVEGSVEILAALVGALLIPFVFTVIYIAVDLILHMIYFFATFSGRRHQPKEKKRARLGGLVGLLSSLAVTVFLLAPLAGTAGLVANAIDGVEDVIVDRMPLEEQQEIKAAFELADSLGSAFPFAAVRALGGQALYDRLAIVHIEGESAPLSGELKTTLDAVPGFMALSSSMQHYGEDEIAAIHSLAVSCENSMVLSKIGGRGLSAMATEALRDHTVLDTPLPDFGPFAGQFMDALFGVLATTDEELVADDIHGFANILSVLVEYDVLLDIGSNDATLENVTADGFAEDLKAVTLAHERYTPLLDEVYHICLLAIASTVDVEAVVEQSPEILDSIAEEIMNIAGSENPTEALRNDVLALLQAANATDTVDVDAITGIASEAILSRFDEGEQIGGDDIKNLLYEYEQALENAGFVFS